MALNVNSAPGSFLNDALQQARGVDRAGVRRRKSRSSSVYTAVLVAGLRKILLAKMATLRVTLRVSNFLNDPLQTRSAAKSRRTTALDWRGRQGSNPRPPA